TAWSATRGRARAARPGARIVVLLAGRLAQSGRSAEVFGVPVDGAVARLVGVENLLPGRIVAEGEGMLEVEVGGAVVAVAGAGRIGAEALVGLRPEDVILEAPGPARLTSAQNRWAGTIAQVTPLGPLYRAVVARGPRLTAVVTRPSVQALGMAPGAAIGVSFKATAARVIRRAGAPVDPGAGERGSTATGASARLDSADSRLVQGEHSARGRTPS